MKALYIGILTSGTTSRMRAERLRELRPDWQWDWIDTDIPMHDSARLWRSLAFRYKIGLAVNRINAAVENVICATDHYDLVWVDKGVFLTRTTMKHLRNRTGRIIHFTPDAAFFANRSRHFEGGLEFYDLVVTTKSFEADDYLLRGVGDRLFITTQGYDASLHCPAGDQTREKAVAFVGLAEPDREACIQELLEAGVAVRLGGQGWGKFLSQYRQHPLLEFLGERVFGKDYVAAYSRVWVGLGLLSKRFPELHTTRTFEIPACGAILATEATSDTTAFFRPDEALFFKDYADLARILTLRLGVHDEAELNDLALRGRRRVSEDGRDYCQILLNILENPRIGLKPKAEFS
jgi:spore maturation protein CgeB